MKAKVKVKVSIKVGISKPKSGFFVLSLFFFSVL